MHPKSSMPLARKHRIFFLDGQPVTWPRYWDEVEYASPAAPSGVEGPGKAQRC